MTAIEQLPATEAVIILIIAILSFGLGFIIGSGSR